jgi:hypothetical protein
MVSVAGTLVVIVVLPEAAKAVVVSAKKVRMSEVVPGPLSTLEPDQFEPTVQS